MFLPTMSLHLLFRLTTKNAAYSIRVPASTNGDKSLDDGPLYWWPRLWFLLPPTCGSFWHRLTDASSDNKVATEAAGKSVRGDPILQVFLKIIIVTLMLTQATLCRLFTAVTNFLLLASPLLWGKAETAESWRSYRSHQQCNSESSLRLRRLVRSRWSYRRLLALLQQKSSARQQAPAYNVCTLANASDQ